MPKKSLGRGKGRRGLIPRLGIHVGLTITLACVKIGMIRAIVPLVTVVSISMTGRTIRRAGSRRGISKGQRNKDGGGSITQT
jgi:hypothetical protein